MIGHIGALRLRGGLVASLLLAGGCGKGPAEKVPADPARPEAPAVVLPADPGERAATCYAARVVTFSDGPLTVEQANQAAHFLLLGASESGITEPTKVKTLQQVAAVVAPAVRQSGTAARQLEACGLAYPATTKRFSALPPDGRDTRLQCFTLSGAMTQIYDRSPEITGDRLTRYRRLAAVLDGRMSSELNPNGRGNLAEIAGLATRSLATAIELGPITDVLDACAARYANPS